MTRKITALLAFTLATLVPVPVLAECCTTSRCTNAYGTGTGCWVKKYPNCKWVKPWQCCGVGRCNILCCNCDGGCVWDHDDVEPTPPDEVVLRLPAEVSDSDLCLSKFSQADDGDGQLTFTEWVRFLGAAADLDAYARWAQFDMENKGYLTEQEALERRA